MAFDHFDKDQSGDICHDEMRDLLIGEGCAASEFELCGEDIDEAMREFTGDQNRRFTFENFKNLMLKMMDRHCSKRYWVKNIEL